MYKKIWGLRQLEKLGFPCPPYQIIDITEDRPQDIERYVLRKIRQVGIPCIKGDRVGVTIRVSMPGALDKLAKHAGLHVVEEKEVLRRVLQKYEQYKPDGKIIVQHTVDARCSGAVLKENGHITIEAIFGDAPPLLEGEVHSYEKWKYFPESDKWNKEETLDQAGKEVEVLSEKDIEILMSYVRLLIGDAYLEWSIAKNDKLYFYEYYEPKSNPCLK